MSGSDSAPEQVTEPTIEVEVPAPRRIEVIGYTESRKEAHWGDPSWEKWLCNDLARFCPNEWHRIYDVHAVADIKKDAAHDAFLKGGSRAIEDGGNNTVSLDGRPVYVFKADPEWPTAQLVPKDELTDAFGDYFSNSISWMVAHAMLEIREAAQKTADIKLAAAGEHAKTQGQSVEDFFGQTSIGLHAAFMHDYEAQCAIHVYGVDMATAGEYGGQRPSCEWILGVAQGRGIETHVPISSDLFKVAAMYGAENDSAMYAKFTERRDELNKRAKALQQNIENAQTQFAQIQGALETTNYVISVWCNPRGTRSEDSIDAPTSEAHLQEAA